MVMRPSHEGGGRAHQQTSSTPHCAGKKNKLVQSDTNIVFESTPDGIEAERLSC